MTSSKKSILPHVVSIVFFALIAIAMVVLYFVFVQRSASVVEESLKVTDSLHPHPLTPPSDLQCE
jgi:hypothetical protein